MKKHVQKHFKNFLDRVHKNYQGQVAIFVALIFQIVFILFALMINVGLLVHHKINLQQSTDLAAYYGAMKQAEMLNVVSHVNFQIRQAYKLLTWRYRILGTFGFQGIDKNDKEVQFPINHVADAYVYNPASKGYKCLDPDINAGPTEIPFMCMNHYGFSDYNAPPETRETYCRVNCSHFKGVATTIDHLSGASTAPAGGHDTAIVTSINDAIAKANANIAAACRATGPTTMALLSKFYASYLQDTRNKKQFIRMLMANLSADEKEQLDIEGKKILDGVLATFKNNLTEANNTSLSKDGNVFETLNSLSPTYGGECHYSDTSYRQKATEPTPAVALFSEINFAFIQYFILKCTQVLDNDPKVFKAQSIYEIGSAPLALNKDLVNQISAETNNPQITAQIKDTMEQNYSDHTMGIEKNPWCGVYYGVKASSTPIIPFLPISKITLHASAFAQPFGGSVGPRAFKEWMPTANKSSGAPESQTDRAMPIQNVFATNEPMVTLKNNARILLNYSNYVGDSQGLANTEVVAIYHDMLLNRSVANNENKPGSMNKIPEPTQGNDKSKPQIWPAYREWGHLANIDLARPDYDPLAHGVGNQNTFMRDIEISVVAPNQFEMTYYSIEPDFYNVYVKGKLEDSIGALKAQAGITSNVYVPKDFGNTSDKDGDPIISGTAKTFSVRNQLAVVQHVLRAGSSSGKPTITNYSFSGSGKHSAGIEQLSSMYFKYIPVFPGSLLTSWTMKDLVSDDYSVITKEDTKMPFGTCLDEDIHGDDGYQSISGQADPRGGSEKLPPAPGNCITGGRTGYSVKIVSPGSLFGDRRLVGGSAVGPLRNQPTGFVSF